MIHSARYTHTIHEGKLLHTASIEASADCDDLDIKNAALGLLPPVNPGRSRADRQWAAHQDSYGERRKRVYLHVADSPN